MAFLARCLFPFSVLVTMGAALPALSEEPCGSWVEGAFPRLDIDGAVSSFALFDDGDGPAVYAAGNFRVAGGAIANGIARWTGAGWEEVGGGVNVEIQALAVFDDGSGPALYAGGRFTTAGGSPAGNIARWDGNSWSEVGGGIGGTVLALLPFDFGSGPVLVAGGNFATAGGVAAGRIAFWDGTSWSPLGGGFGDKVNALASFDNGSGPALHVGGRFGAGSGDSVEALARWDGTAFLALGGGIDGEVRALAVYDDGSGPALYAGGRMTHAGGLPALRIARWDGTAWSAVGAGVFPGDEGSTVSALAVFDDGLGPELVLGGDFESILGTRDVVAWNGTEYRAIGDARSESGVKASVGALIAASGSSGAELWAGGRMRLFDGLPVRNVARRRSGAAWDRAQDGSDGIVFALAVHDDGSGTRLFAGGLGFAASGGGRAGEAVASWDASGWTIPTGALPIGFPRTVLALAPYTFQGTPRLAIGGAFGSGLAEWSGGDVHAFPGSPIGSGPVVFALESFDDDGGGATLFAGGDLSGGVVAFRNGAWPVVGSGTNEPVTALRAFDDGSGPALYAGGSFTSAGGAPASFIARWNGAVWSGVGGGINGPVKALAIFDDGSGPALYAAGNFSVAGGVPASFVAKWNGVAWSPLGSGLNGRGLALAVHDDGSGPALFAGGEFSTAGGALAAHVARWDGASWSALGSGTDVTVTSLASFDDGSGPALFAGGYFGTAGGAISPGIAKWSSNCTRCRAGNVNAAAGPAANVLFVNGMRGQGPKRILTVDRLALFQIRMKSPPSLESAAFALWAFVGAPDETTVTPLFSYGSTCKDPATSKKRWNNTGDPRFGSASFPSTEAPSLVFRRASGVKKRLTFFLQGVIEDPASPSGEWAVTNGIEVVSD